MPSGSTLAVFCVAALALIVVPGPAVTYIVTQSIDRGRGAGLVSALGIASGGLVHVVAAVIGLSALLASSATAFTVVKLVGAGYLILIGLRRLLVDDEGRGADATPPDAPRRRLFLQGAVVNVLNPKTALFFLAFLLKYIFALELGVLPVSGRQSSNIEATRVTGFFVLDGILTREWDAAWDAFRHLILPAIALATIPFAVIFRITRASVL